MENMEIRFLLKNGDPLIVLVIAKPKDKSDSWHKMRDKLASLRPGV